MLALGLTAAGIGTAATQTAGQPFAQIADLDPQNGVGPRLTWTVTSNKLGNRIFGNLDQKITLIDAVASPPIVYEFATDAYWNRVLFSQKDVYIKAFRNTGTGLTGLSAPGGLDISARKTLFIADRLNSRVVIARFDPAARTLTQIGLALADQSTGVLRNVVDVAWDGRGAPLTDEFFYALDGDGQVSYWQWNGYMATRQWTYASRGTGPGQFLSPSGICVGHQSTWDGGSIFTSDFYVTDAGTRRVTWFSRGVNGPEYPTSVALPNDGVPSDCTVDHFGNVIVADSKNHRLVKFNRPLWYLDSYGSYGVGPASTNTFDTPHAIHAPFGTKRNAAGSIIWYGEGRVLTAERWTDQTGGLEHYLGIRATYTGTPDTSSTDAWVSLTVTDVGYVNADIYQVGVGNVRALIRNQLWNAGSHTLLWDGRKDDGTPAAPATYKFSFYMMSAYGCPNNFYTSWCFPGIQSQSFYFKYCPPTGGGGGLKTPGMEIQTPYSLPYNPCNAASPPTADAETNAPATLFLHQRVVLGPQPLTRSAGGGGPRGSGTVTEGFGLEDAVRRLGIRGLSFGVTPEASGSPVKIRIYSIAGRPVRTLVSEQLAAGTYDVAWDGLDDGGRPAGPGVYVALLTVGSFRAVQRLILRQ